MPSEITSDKTKPAHAARSENMARAIRLWITAGPGLAWIILFLIVPSAILLGIGFMSNGDYGSPHLPLTLDPFKEVAGFSILGWADGNLITLLRSLVQSFIATFITVLLAYPVVFFIITRRPEIRPLLLLFVILPSWTNQVVRAYAWVELLGPRAPLSGLAQSLGLIPPNLGLMPTNFSVLIGLTYNYLPYMVVPLYAAAEKLDWSLVEAGRDLYASGPRLFWAAVFPQTLPGLLSGIILVAIPAFGDYIVPTLLGGNRVLMMGSLIASQFTETPNWPYGAALTIIMLLFTCGGLIVFRRMTKRLGGGDGAML
ncbi:MAG: spermidine/putrescine ABC transporter permease [Rhodospirillales bacterium 20-60-12]|nr:MAG: spermidine/putrescine ABC transporter permease [Rhodospirillales bacterium 20-60-12]HQT66330.1 ABC transporter permease [Acetobacteraceae bacterium]